MRVTFCFAVVLLTLCACGRTADPNVLRTQFERIDLSATKASVALVELPEINAIALLSEAGRNGDVITFSSSDRRTVSLRRGVLVRTAGFGHDLFYADPIATLRAITAGRATSYQRRYQYLTAADDIDAVKVDCEMRFESVEATRTLGKMRSLTRSVETCRGKDVSFRNEYWSDAAGTIHKSKEMLSPVLEHAIIETYVR